MIRHVMVDGQTIIDLGKNALKGLKHKDINVTLNGVCQKYKRDYFFKDNQLIWKNYKNAILRVDDEIELRA